MKPKNLKNVVITVQILLVLFVLKKTCTHKTKIFYRKAMNKVVLKLLVLRKFYILKIIYNIVVLFYKYLLILTTSCIGHIDLGKYRTV